MIKVYVPTIIKSVHVILKGLCFLNASCVSPQIIMDADPQLKVGFIGAGNMAFGIAKGLIPGEGRMVLRHRSRVWVKESDECLLFCCRKRSSWKRQSERTFLQKSGTISGTFQHFMLYLLRRKWQENTFLFFIFLYSQWDLPDKVHWSVAVPGMSTGGAISPKFIYYFFLLSNAD